MEFKEKEILRSKIENLENYRGASKKEEKKEIFEILLELLKEEGYSNEETDLSYPIKPFIGSVINNNDRIGLYIDSGVLNNGVGLNRYILFGKSKGFNRNIIFLHRKMPEISASKLFKFSNIEVETVDFPKIKNWLSNLNTETEDLNDCKILSKFISNKLAKIIINNPEEIEKIEWRQMEILISDLLEEIGFQIELTPQSGDGGKDIILRCNKKGTQKSYIIEIKHWSSRQKVGQGHVKKFLKVIVNEAREKGLFISTFGFSDNAFESFSEFDRERIKFAEKEKIVSLCKMYTRKRFGIWLPEEVGQDLLFADTE